MGLNSSGSVKFPLSRSRSVSRPSQPPPNWSGDAFFLSSLSPSFVREDLCLFKRGGECKSVFVREGAAVVVMAMVVVILNGRTRNNRRRFNKMIIIIIK